MPSKENVQIHLGEKKNIERESYQSVATKQEEASLFRILDLHNTQQNKSTDRNVPKIR